MGGGALYFALQPEHAILADNNPELITTYAAVRDHPAEVHDALVELGGTADEYYDIRSRTMVDPIDIAARFLYLRAYSYGGLYRVNRRGDFNVPYGGLRRQQVTPRSEIESASRSLSGVEVRVSDFGETLRDAGATDLIYADPPYVSQDGGGTQFNRYLARSFSFDHQVELAKLLSDLVVAGATVLASNCDSPEVRRLYPSELFYRFRVGRRSAVASDPLRRGPVTEAVFVSRGHSMSRSTVLRCIRGIAG